VAPKSVWTSAGKREKCLPPQAAAGPTVGAGGRAQSAAPRSRPAHWLLRGEVVFVPRVGNSFPYAAAAHVVAPTIGAELAQNASSNARESSWNGRNASPFLEPPA
jgi:hypothetical protein